jgi:hypothetical protein
MKGSIKNPFHKSVYGVGFSGIGKYSCKNYPKIHKTWTGMLERGYSEIHNTKAPTYKDCIADDAWHNFQNFAKWMEENFNSNYMSNWQLDKDILIKGNKIYSSETCCFVPKEINEIFKKSNFNKLCVKGVQKTKWGYIARCASQGVRVHLGTFDTPEEAFQAYKTAKEKHIKSVADKWKSLISDNVYQAMYNYEVEITD